jgi:hypothetical protein
MTNNLPPQQSAMAQPGQNQTLYHVCFGSRPDCSGCNPCPACQDILKLIVFEQVFAMIGLDANYVREPFAAAFSQALDRLHLLMQQDAYLKSQYQVTALRAQAQPPPPVVVMPIAPMAAQAAQAATAPQSRVGPFPDPSAYRQPPPPVQSQAAATLPAPSESGKLTAASPAASLDAEPARVEAVPPMPTPPASPEQPALAPVRSMVRPMTIEEIAASAHVEDDPTEAGLDREDL